MSQVEGAEAQPKIEHHFGGGVYSKETHIPCGMSLLQHRHEHDHLSILASGTVEVSVDGTTRTITGPACLTVIAGQHHAVRALSDSVWFCIHATDCTDSEKVDAVLIAPSDMQQVASLREIAGRT